MLLIAFSLLLLHNWCLNAFLFIWQCLHFWQGAKSNLSYKSNTWSTRKNVQITHKNIIIRLDKTLTAHFRGKGSTATAVVSQPWRFWKCSCCTPQLRQLWKWRPQINKSSSETHDKWGNAYIFTLYLWIVTLVHMISCCDFHASIFASAMLKSQSAEKQFVSLLTLYHCTNNEKKKKKE